jgi:ribosomal protein S12 methylthiotransferase
MVEKIGVVSLGCFKNLVDTEIMLGYLKEQGFEIVDVAQSDLVLVNTCAFLRDAVIETEDTIKRVSSLGKQIILAGCYTVRFGKRSSKASPAIRSLITPSALDRIVDAVKKPGHYDSGGFDQNTPYPRLLTTLPHTAFLKVAEGCSNRCSYCLIPSLRGEFRSRSPDSILAEAESLCSLGVREVNLISQDTARFGTDLPGSLQLPDLIKCLARLEQLRWIRILYLYPTRVSDKLIDVVGECEKVCSYLDIPIQHVSERVLSSMKRPYTKKFLMGLISKIRRRIPNITLRTTVMVGHPGEGAWDFRELLDFLKEAEFDSLGVFKYSDEPGTVSSRLPEKVPEHVMEERYQEVLELQRTISQRRARRWMSKEVEVLIERKKDGIFVGRTQHQAPEVDGVTFIKTLPTIHLKVGEFYKVQVNGTSTYDLWGELLC